jgi:conjugative relaxase-like TrwC/TraI family protein
MLSIGPLGDHSAQYYMDLANEDYYLDGGEPPGLWAGQGSAALGLDGVVDRRPFYSIFNGVSPVGAESLVQKQPDTRHHPGWDLTFSAPKSVSVLWSQADESTRHAIQRLQREAVGAALQYLEDHAAVTRRGKGGVEREAVHLISALFEHGTSRAQDPQLHTHALLFNVGVRSDGTTGAIHGPLFYLHKMAAGALYRAELSMLLQRELGIAVERDGTAFGVKGVPATLVREFSKRRQEIENELKARGLNSARAAAIATLETRATKDHTSRKELLLRWQDIGREHGFTRDEVMAVLGRREAALNTEAACRKAVDTAIELLTLGQSYFTQRELLRYVAEQGQWCGLGCSAVRAAVRKRLADEREVVRVGELKREAVYTTLEMLQVEQKLLAQADRLRDDTDRAKGVLVSAFVGFGMDFSPDQRAAYLHLMRGEGRIHCVDGYAGTGKTSLLEAAHRAWLIQGYEVVGATVSAKAARGLETATGMRSMTIEQLLYSLDRPTGAMIGYHYRQIGRALAGRRNYSPDEAFLTLSKDTILVIDEASMVGTRDMARIMDHVARSGAQLKLIGDRRQLQAITAGNPFAALCELLGCKQLKAIRRQREEWARQAVRDLAEGDAEKALRAYAEHGFVAIAKDREGAQEALIGAWCERGLKRPQEHVIFTSTREEANLLNRRIQQERRKAGRLGALSITVGDTEFRIGDRVAFLRNHRTLGVENGMLGTIKFVEPITRNLMVRLDDGRLVGVPLLRYTDIALGYAITTHKGQGATVENAYILMGGRMQDQEMSYVQLSRARGETRIFVDEHEAGKELKDLVKQMGTSRRKELASDILKRGQTQEEAEPHRTDDMRKAEREAPDPEAHEPRSAPREEQEREQEIGRTDRVGEARRDAILPTVVMDGPTLERGLRETTGARAEVLALIRQGRIRLVLSQADRDMLLRHDNPTVREIACHADAVQVVDTVRANDSRDGPGATSVKGHTLELALEVGAAYVVTDDRELLALAKGRSRSTASLREALRGITILTPAELVRDLTHDQSQERGQARSREHDQQHGR